AESRHTDFITDQRYPAHQGDYVDCRNRTDEPAERPDLTDCLAGRPGDVSDDGQPRGRDDPGTVVHGNVSVFRRPAERRAGSTAHPEEPAGEPPASRS